LPESLNLPAFAKINLSLRVLGKRADGYHEVETIFQTVSLHDTLRLSVGETPDIKFWCDDRYLPASDDNLVIQAAAALQECLPIKKGAIIRLEKRIPTQAGLGGGSADAAMTLIGLSYLWLTDVTADTLSQIAAKIGADVPFFLFGGTARGTGIGNQITPLADLVERFLLIVKPNANISTARAYQTLDEQSLTSKVGETILHSSQHAKSFDFQDVGSLQNDFEAIAFALEPEIQRAKTALVAAGAVGTLLAGSGSAVFGIFDSEDAQRRATQAIELETGWRVFPCKTVGREQFEAAMGAASKVLRRFSGQ
jgi:4-diphosphocytidyl-2-C-methyl-D-erythritol kinase